MSWFLEILGRILSCKEELHDDSDDGTSYPLLGRNFASRIHNRVLYRSNSTSISINYEQQSGSGSSVVTSPSFFQNRIVTGSRTSEYSASTGYPCIKSTERITQLQHGCSNYTPLNSTSKPPSTSPSLNSSPSLPAAVAPSASKPTVPVSKPSGSRTSEYSASTGYPCIKSTERITQLQHECSNYTPSLNSTSKPPSTSPSLNSSPSLPAAVAPSASKPTVPVSKPSGSRTSEYSASTGYPCIKSTERITQLQHGCSNYTPSLTSTSKPPSTLPSLNSSPSLPAAVAPSVSKPTVPVSKPSTSASKPSSSSFQTTPSSLKSSLSFKVTLSPASSSLTDEKDKTKYVLSGKDPLPIYIIPADIKALIEKNIVPGVLSKPLHPSTYKDHFAALLYAEDHYIEKWSDFQLVNVAVELHKAAISRKLSNKKLLHESDEENNKVFAAFEVDSIPQKRPFLLSRDFVFAKPTGRKVNPFQGIIYRVQKSTTVLVEFVEDFYSQHHPNRKYDISFSFNRVCLKRAHQAISAASDPLFQDYIFPDSAFRKIITASAPLISSSYELDSHQNSAIRHILSFQGPPPYLVEGPLCVSTSKLSKSGMVVQEAVLKIYKGSPQSRILICAPINKTCDVLMRSLKKEIPESHMFRANAAFRELDGVPVDILPSCLHEGGSFSCPPLQELRAFRVILSTFASSYRLHNEGITAGHFSHIFLVDASSATEPETMIALSNMANEKTAVVVTGAPNNHSGWVRSNIARENGLRVSYFKRLRQSRRYSSLDPMFITRLVD